MDRKYNNARKKVDEVKDLFSEVLKNKKVGMTLSFTPNSVYPDDRFLIFSAWKKHKVTFRKDGWLEFNHDEPIRLEEVPKSFLKSILLKIYYEQETK